MRQEQRNKGQDIEEIIEEEEESGKIRKEDPAKLLTITISAF